MSSIPLLSRFLLAAAVVGALAAGTELHAEPIPGLELSEIDRARAAEETREANRLYRAGEFVRAAELYKSAYVRSGEPALLFNLGQTSRMRGDHQRAVFYLSMYLREVPDAHNREVVAELLEEERQQTQKAPFRAHSAARSVSVASTPAFEPRVRDQRPAEQPVYTKWWFWTAVAGGAAVLVTTAVLTSSDGGDSMPSLGAVDWR